MYSTEDTEDFRTPYTHTQAMGRVIGSFPNLFVGYENIRWFRDVFYRGYRGLSDTLHTRAGNGAGYRILSEYSGLQVDILNHTLECTATRCNILQHIAPHCTTLQHPTPHCNTLHHTATHCNTRQHTAMLCSALQRTATQCQGEYAAQTGVSHHIHFDSATHCNTLQRTATHCNTVSRRTCGPNWSILQNTS